MPTVYPFETPSAKYYYSFGDNIGIYPTPTEIKVIRMHYIYTPTTLAADADTPAIRADFHDAIVKYATFQIMKRLNPQATALLKQDWEEAKDEAVTSHFVAEEVIQTPHKDY